MAAPHKEELFQPDQDALDAEQEHQHAMETVMLSKGLVPHRTTGPFGSSEYWERPNVPEVNYWPFVVLSIAALLFVLFVIKGVPWQ